MKKISLFAAVCAASVVALAATAEEESYGSPENWVAFKSAGPDKYRDGTTVLDGETYALVFTKAGAEFGGIDAQGNLLDDDSVVIDTAACARNGGCPWVCFMIAENVQAALGDGEYAVYLLDTRVRAQDGTEAIAAGEDKIVNGYEKVDATINVHVGSAVAQTAATGEGVVASAVPSGAPQAKIEKFDRIDGKVYIKVTDLVPYIQYTIAGGEQPSGDYEDLAKGVNGVEGGMTLVAPDDGKKRFFKVDRSK